MTAHRKVLRIERNLSARSVLVNPALVRFFGVVFRFGLVWWWDNLFLYQDLKVI